MAALKTLRPKEKEWQTVPKKTKNPQKQRMLVLTKAQEKEDWRMIFRRAQGAGELKADRADFILALNLALTKLKLLSFLRVVDVGYTSSGAISALLKDGALSSIVVLKYTDILLTVVRKVNANITAVEASQCWY
jgi:hypothetical protein